MLGSVKCQACGAKVREDRVRCLRCGAALTGTPPVARTQRLSLPVVAMVAAGIALGGFAALLAGRAGGEPAVAAAPAATARATTAPAVEESGEEAARRAAASVPAPIAVSMDISRGAVAAYSRGDVAGSLDQFSAAVAAAPDNPDALNNLGQVLVRSGRAREAIPHFDRAIAIADTVWAYHFNRARAYAELSEWPRAIAGYLEAARLFPDDYVTAFNLARALQANGDVGGAITEYQRAVALAPAEPDFHLSLAFALETAQRPAEAVEAYRRYLDLQAEAPEADKIRARIAQLQGQPSPGPAPQAP